MEKKKNHRKLITVIIAASMTVSALGGLSVSADYSNTHGTSNDNGDGTYLNPVLNTDVADPDIICAPSPDGTEAYYMVSTAMQYSPGCPIMKSTDLVNWETINYLYDTLDYESDALALRNGEQAYGSGQWATSIRYNKDNQTFYILTFSYTTGTTQVYTSKNVEEGPWKKSEFKVFHDPSIFIDDDGRIYVFYGQNSLNCKELVEKDGYLSIKEEADDPDNVGKVVVPDMGDYEVPDCIYPNCDPPENFIIKGEGTHAYKVDGKYYLISITWPSGPRNDGTGGYWKRGMICFRSDNVYGPYEGMLIMNQEANFDGYVGGGGPGQGGMTNVIGGDNRSSDGDWYGLIFQDRGALGRCPLLVNVDWNTPGYEAWPMMTATETGIIPTEGGKSEIKSLVKSDEFDNGTELNYAPVITKESEAENTLTLAESVSDTVKLQYTYNNAEGAAESIEIGKADVTSDGWMQITGKFTAPEVCEYGRIEIVSENTVHDFYVDDVSVKDPENTECLENGEMNGEGIPWWWGATSVWDNETSSNVDTSTVSTSSDEYHNSAPSMLVTNRKSSAAGAMQYWNDDIVSGTEYTVSAWIKLKADEEEQPSGTEEPSSGEKELVINGDFESGSIEPWTARYNNGTVVEISDVSASGNYGMAVSGRSSTGDGPKLELTGEITLHTEYTISAMVRYDSGPDEKQFNITLEHTNAENVTGWTVLGSVTAKRGEWTEINAVITLPEETGIQSNNIYFETPYTSSPDAVNDLMDFYVDDISVYRGEEIEWEEVYPGENEPNGSYLDLVWQWNHNPDNRLWSLTERPGYLRLTNGRIVDNIQQARNTLTQRTYGPECSGWTSMDTENMADGDYAGLAGFAPQYGFIGVKKENGKRYIVYADTPGVPADDSAMMNELPNVQKLGELTQNTIYLRTDFTFAGNGTDDTASFYYSLDGEKWTFVKKMTGLQYSMLHFTGYKYALFNYATENTGGYVDFDYFRIDDKYSGSGETEPTEPPTEEPTPEIPDTGWGELIKNGSFDNGSENWYNFGGCAITAADGKLSVTGRTDSWNGAAQTVNGMLTGATYKLKADVTVDTAPAETVTITATISYSDENNESHYIGVGQITLKEGESGTLNSEFVLENEIPENVTLYFSSSENSSDLADFTLDNVSLNRIKPTNTLAKNIGMGNPLVTHKFGADPWVMEYDGRVYVYMTNDKYRYDENGNLIQNSYASINSLSVISSDDMINWTDHGEIAIGGKNTNPEALPNGAAAWAANSWAPSVVHKEIDGKDKFFIYFADNASGIGVLEGDSPVGPFVDPIGKPLVNGDVTGGTEGVVWFFDPAVLVDDDGSAYMYFGGGLPTNDEGKVEANHPYSSAVIKLGDDMISTVGDAVMIDAPGIFEDSGIHKYGDTYYYSYCTNFECTNVPQGAIAYMTSDNPMGPFEYQGVILNNMYVYFGTGGNNHHAVFDFNGKWYISYHAATVQKADIGLPSDFSSYRSTHINEFTYNQDGTIPLITADYQGVDQLKNLDAFGKIPASTIAWQSGVKTENMNGDFDGNAKVTDIDDGDWTSLSQVDFGANGSEKIKVSAASEKGGTIGIVIDDFNNEPICEIKIEPTGGEFKEFSADLKLSGVHDIFFVYEGDGSDLFELESYSFTPASVEVPDWSVTASDNGGEISAEIRNNNSEITEVTVYAAVYDNEGRLVSVKAADKTIQKNKTENVSFDMSGNEYKTASVMVWQQSSSKPLAEKTEL